MTEPNPYLPFEAQIVERLQESPTIFTLRLRIVDAQQRSAYRFEAGQFNMVYLYGVGEVPISIVSDPRDPEMLDHTIRAVGRVTRGLAALKAGDGVGLRGPYGRGWPLQQALGRDVVLATGGLGCAPVVSVINFILQRRDQFGRLVIMQGVKHSDDLIWRKQYEVWEKLPDTQVLLAADQADKHWVWRVGRPTELVSQAQFDRARHIVMMCGPEVMMRLMAEALLAHDASEDWIWLSMERNMQCAVGHCGHCQRAERFVCKDGPVFRYTEMKDLLAVKGF